MAEFGAEFAGDELSDLLLHQIAEKICGGNWRRVMLSLDLGEHIISAQERNHVGRIQDTVYSLLIIWKRNVPDASQQRSSLYGALLDANWRQVALEHLGSLAYDGSEKLHDRRGSSLGKLRVVLLNYSRLASVEFVSRPRRLRAMRELADRLRALNHLVREVKFVDIGWYGIGAFLPTLKEADVLLVCPSGLLTFEPTIKKLLPAASESIGKDNIAVLLGDRFNPQAVFPYSKHQKWIKEYADLILFCDCASQLTKDEHWNTICSFIKKTSGLLDSPGISASPEISDKEK